MRKILLSIVFLLVLCGCGVNNNKTVKEKSDDNKEKREVVTTVVQDTYVDNNPIKQALYIDKIKQVNYDSPMTIYKDIVSLECYFTDDDKLINGNMKEVFNNYYSKYQNILEYRIGYHIKFTTTDGEVDKYIYNPSDVESFFNYIQVYLYDDIHQNSSWYSHVTKEEYNSNTMLTSIKLTASTDIDKVIGDVKVSSFTYIKEDIDSKGSYKGKNEYTVIIRKN